MSAPELSVVLLSWNTRELLRRCLATLEAADKPASEVIVVDNKSSDGSADMVAAEFQDAILVRNAANEGFARGCNQGIARARGRYVLLLNSDTEVYPDALRLLYDFLELHPAYAAAAPRLVHPDGRTQRACQRFPGWWTPLFFGTPLERWLPHSPELNRYFLRDWDHEDERDVEQPPAACLLLRRSVLDEVGRSAAAQPSAAAAGDGPFCRPIGVFDERLWLFFNDVDLSRRLCAAGKRTRYVAGARVVHHVGASTRQFGGLLLEWQKNRLTYYRKHHGRLAGPWVKLCVSLAWADFCVTQLWRRLRGRAASPLLPTTLTFREFLSQ